MNVAPSLRSATLRAAFAVLLLLLPLIASPGAARATEREAGAPAPLRLEGMVRDANGVPLSGALVRARITRWTTDGSRPQHERYTWTDAYGRYRLDDVTHGLPADALWAAQGQATLAEHPPAERELLDVLRDALAGGDAVARADFVIDTATATLAGRLRIRASDEPLAPTPFAGATVTLTQTDGSGVSRSTAVEPDGRFRISVPPGRYRVTGNAPAGALPAIWPGLPSITPIDAPAIELRRDELRDDLELALRARLPYTAVTEFGQHVEGWDPRDPRNPRTGEAPRCYPRDTEPVPGTSGSRAALVGEPVRNDGGQLRGGVAVGEPIFLVVRNVGDRMLWLDRVRLEGDGANSYHVASTGVTFSRCASPFLAPGEAHLPNLSIALYPVPGVRQPDVLRMTAVIGHDQGELRVPIDARRTVRPASPTGKPSVPSAAPTSSRPTGPKATGTAPTLAALELGRRTLRVHFPAAGTAVVAFQRRGGGRRARWRTVRSVRLRASGTSDRTARVPRLRPGRYRVRLTTEVVGQPRRTLEVLHRVRR
jgi:hypothetical protein